MKAKNPGALSGRTWTSILLFGLIGQIAWVVENMYFSRFMQNEITRAPYATTLMVAFSAAEFAALALSAPFWVYETLLFAILFSLGLTFTSTTTLAMNLARDNAGTASAVFGAAGFAFGGLVSPLVGLGDMLTTTGIVFLAGSLLSFFFAAFATKK